MTGDGIQVETLPGWVYVTRWELCTCGVRMVRAKCRATGERLCLACLTERLRARKGPSNE